MPLTLDPPSPSSSRTRARVATLVPGDPLMKNRNHPELFCSALATDGERTMQFIQTYNAAVQRRRIAV
jgi:hypothetical protein